MARAYAVRVGTIPAPAAGSYQVERAISVSGAEFTPATNTATQAFSNVNVQTYASDYRYEGTPSVLANANKLTFDYLYSRGWRRVKIPIRWERIQRTLGGALDSTELSRLLKCLDKAGESGMTTVLDIHNYGLYYLDGSQTTPTQTTNTGYRQPIGGPVVTQSHFADLWTRLTTSVLNHATIVGAHIMNEPQATGGLTRTVWYACAQAAVTAIRDAGNSTVVIRVGGWQWSDCYNWTVNNPTGLWITDPANLTWYEAHHYWSESENGQYTSYANALAHAVAQGHTAGSNTDALHTKVLYDLNQFAAWCSSYGVKGVIGEINWPGNAAGGDQALWNAVGQVYLARADTLGMHVDCWSTGEFYGTSSDPLLTYNATGGTSTGVNTTRSSAATWEAHPAFTYAGGWGTGGWGTQGWGG